ncbi:MAG: GntR family transcriptional regulator [Lachnospiraceae bacterium]|jgi:DNA-binding transcriptional regulator YhcF (GntR family)|nr:GntR family transcriptional regulator [Lachnospiraceae bacterium]
MFIEIDFESEEAIYIQIRNQIVMGIATSAFREGDVLPSVRRLAESAGINMHTVNKAYNMLKNEGFISLSRRHGAVISIEADKQQDIMNLKENLRILLAEGYCKNISKEEVHGLVEEIFAECGE